VPLSKSLLSYKDCRDLCERAMQAPKGIKVRPGEAMSAKTLRTRLYHFRKMERDYNRRIYQPGDPLYDQCTYDELMFKLDDHDPTTLWILNTTGKNDRYVIEEVLE
jgi:hypothetical protein